MMLCAGGKSWTAQQLAACWSHGLVVQEHQGKGLPKGDLSRQTHSFL